MRRVPTAAEWRSRALDFWARSLTNKVVVICTAIFCLQELNLFFASAFFLNMSWIKSGFLLNFLTYGFLHGGFWHIVLNMLALYFAGNAVERYDSGKDALIAFLGGIVAGGAAWTASVMLFSVNPLEQTLVGASAGIAALFAYFSIFYRNAEIRAMIFFVLPVRMRAWVIFAVLVGFSVIGFIFDELPALRLAGTQSLSVAHSAHLGGLIFGALFAWLAECFRKNFENIRYFRR